MNAEQAKQLLGLEVSVSNEAALAELNHKRTQLEEKRNAAPTDALKAKFEQSLKQLAEAEKVLRQSASPAPRSPLSETKMADLPGMAPMGSHGDATVAQQLQFQPGDILAGRYQIKEQIGAGGMGAVYRAHDQNRAEDIAIKVLLPSLTAHERARERFLDEARLSSKLSHPNIVNVYDVQQDGETYFLTMELLEGQSLRSFIDNHHQLRQQVEVSEALEIASAVCEGLVHAHELTVHRDIKPENIFLGEDGKVKLMDFGIARLVSTSQRTQTGAAMGTAYYMAPEQLKGRGEIDGRADQYAVGVLLYELLSGEVPTGRMESLNKLRKDVPKTISLAVDKALSPKPENRYADIKAFMGALNGGKKAVALPSFTFNPKMAGIAAGALLLIGIGVAAMQNGNLGETLKGLLPESEEVLQARKMNTITLQARVKARLKDLADSERAYDEKLRERESEQRRLQGMLRTSRSKDEKAQLQTEIDALAEEITQIGRESQLLKQVMFERGRTEREGQVALADALIRDADYKNAIEVLTPLDADLQSRLTNIGSVSAVLAARVNHEKAHSNWQAEKPGDFCDEFAPVTERQYLESTYTSGLGDCVMNAQLLKHVKQRATTAKEQTDNGEWVSAIGAFTESAAIYSAFADVVDRMEKFPVFNKKYKYVDSDDLAKSTLAQGGPKLAERISHYDAKSLLADWAATSLIRNDSDEKERYQALTKKMAAEGNTVAALRHRYMTMRKYVKPTREEIDTRQYEADHTEALGYLTASGFDMTSPQGKEITERVQFGQYDRLWQPFTPPLPLTDYVQARASLEAGIEEDDTTRAKRLAFLQYHGLGGPKDEAAAIATLKNLHESKKSLGNEAAYVLAKHYGTQGELLKAAKLMSGMVSGALTLKLEMEKGVQAIPAAHPEAYAWLVEKVAEEPKIHDLIFYLYVTPYTYGIEFVSGKGMGRGKVTAEVVEKIMALAEPAAAHQGKEANKFLYDIYTGGGWVSTDTIREMAGIKKDEKKAFAYLRVLAEELGEVEYFDNLARAYYKGEYVKKSSKKGEEWYARYASTKDTADVYNTVGRAYKNNKYMQDYKKARDYFLKAYAKDSKNINTNNQLGYLYFEGLGVKEDKKRAHGYFLTAAKEGSVTDMEWVAYNYLYGRGIAKNKKEAKAWSDKMTKAAKTDDQKKRAKELRDDLK